jgi:hypothetical protein
MNLFWKFTENPAFQRPYKIWHQKLINDKWIEFISKNNETEIYWNLLHFVMSSTLLTWFYLKLLFFILEHIFSISIRFSFFSLEMESLFFYWIFAGLLGRISYIFYSWTPRVSNPRAANFWWKILEISNSLFQILLEFPEK